MTASMRRSCTRASAMARSFARPSTTTPAQTRPWRQVTSVRAIGLRAPVDVALAAHRDARALQAADAALAHLENEPVEQGDGAGRRATEIGSRLDRARAVCEDVPVPGDPTRPRDDARRFDAALRFAPVRANAAFGTIEPEARRDVGRAKHEGARLHSATRCGGRGEQRCGCESECDETAHHHIMVGMCITQVRDTPCR